MPQTQSQLTEFLAGAGSRPYRELIEYHIKRQATARLMQACLGEASKLPNCTGSDVEALIDSLNARFAYDQDFWRNSTCAEAIRSIVEVSAKVLPLGNVLSSPAEALKPENHDLTFALFQIATLSFAYSASTQKAQRKFMGIKKGWFG